MQLIFTTIRESVNDTSDVSHVRGGTTKLNGPSTLCSVAGSARERLILNRERADRDNLEFHFCTCLDAPIADRRNNRDPISRPGVTSFGIHCEISR